MEVMRFKKLAALGATAVMLMSMSLTSVSAANIKNTSWNFNIDWSHNSVITDLREKTNSSAVYAKYTDGTAGSVSFDVLNSEKQSMCKKTGGLAKGQEGRIAQYVYENGFRWCHLKVTAPFASYGGAGGVWSPDCAGSYPYINL